MAVQNDDIAVFINHVAALARALTSRETGPMVEEGDGPDDGAEPISAVLDALQLRGGGLQRPVRASRETEFL